MSQVEIPLFANGNFPLVTVKIIFFQPEPSLILEKKKNKNSIDIPFLLAVTDDSCNGLCYLFLTLK